MENSYASIRTNLLTSLDLGASALRYFEKGGRCLHINMSAALAVTSLKHFKHLAMLLSLPAQSAKVK